jgi:SAM-dependent methyltransferase
MNKEYVQFGCGFSAPEKWRNFDASPTLRFEKIPVVGRLYTRNSARFPKSVEYGDIVRGLPIAEESTDGVYCSHVLEHLSLEDFRSAISNTYQILKPGGYFRLVLPDLEYAINQYNQQSSPVAAFEFMRNTILGKEKSRPGLRAFVSEWLGHCQHLWMWDYKSIAHELQQTGFTNLRRATFGDSADPMFRDVEDETRWVDALGVECRKGECVTLRKVA